MPIVSMLVQLAQGGHMVSRDKFKALCSGDLKRQRDMPVVGTLFRLSRQGQREL